MNEQFNGDGIWLFALLILLFGMNGTGFGGGLNRAASVDDLNNTSNFTRMESQVRANADLTERKTDAINNGLCSLGYEMAQQMGAISKQIIESQYATSQEINALSSKMDAEKIASLQAQVSDLKTQQMFCGIPRINPYGYGVYAYNNGCGCNSNNI